MVDPQLQSVKAHLLADQQQGMVGRGTTTLHPKVVALSATSATIVDCPYSRAELVYQASGKPVPPITPPENDGVRSTLILTSGMWKVYKQTGGKDRACRLCRLPRRLAASAGGRTALGLAPAERGCSRPRGRTPGYWDGSVSRRSISRPIASHSVAGWS